MSTERRSDEMWSADSFRCVPLFDIWVIPPLPLWTGSCCSGAWTSVRAPPLLSSPLCSAVADIDDDTRRGCQRFSFKWARRDVTVSAPEEELCTEGPRCQDNETVVRAVWGGCCRCSGLIKMRGEISGQWRDAPHALFDCPGPARLLRCHWLRSAAKEASVRV